MLDRIPRTEGTLDYLELLKEFRDHQARPTKAIVKVAILADFALQQLIPLLVVFAARRGFRLEVYEGGYDAIQLEVFDRNSGLYVFKPDFVAILMTTQHLRSRIYLEDDRASFTRTSIEQITALWSAVSECCNAKIVQSIFVLPPERAFGNYELNVGDSVGSIITAINHGITEAAQRSKNVLLCDADFVAAMRGRRQWFDDRLWSMAKTYCRLDDLPYFARNVADVMLASVGVAAKCVIVDLDNTLWGGIIGDDGLNGILLGDHDEGECFVALQRFLLELKRRGVLLAVVSKNEHAAAVMPFREHPNMVLKESDIAVFIANWDNKATNIKIVQKTLNIGFDSMVFLDDNPFERDLIREHLPDVIVPELPDDPALYLSTLADLNLFETASYSSADRQRTDQYLEEAQRSSEKTSYVDISDYLRSLRMKVKLERFSPMNLPRIAQLIQRSNQFNLMTRRYSEAACERLMNDPNYMPFTLSLADRFGDYGLISVVVLKCSENSVVIDEFLMSCRTLQRGVEQFAMNSIVNFARESGAKSVEGRYIRTKKNEMVRELFGTFGFEKIAGTEHGDTDWRIRVDAYVPAKTYLEPVVAEI